MAKKCTMFAFTFIVVSTLGGLLQTSDAAPNLNSFSPKGGNKIVGSASSETGSDVAMIGDHNGDGFADYIVGAQALSMTVIVMKAGNTAHSEIIDMASVVSGQFFRVIRGPELSRLGSAVGGVGDINDDSFDDVIVGASEGVVPGRGYSGFAFVIFGMEGPFTDLHLTATWSASAIGFMILGPADRVGFVDGPRTARGLGDVNGDGISDFAVSARMYSGTTDKTNAGVVWLIHGRKDPLFDTIDLLHANFAPHGACLTGAEANDKFGHSVMPAGDFNGDGLDDFLIGAPYARFVAAGADRAFAGAAYLLYGSKTVFSTLDMSKFVTGVVGVRFGTDAYNQLGSALSGVGDVNGDGFDDIAIGAKHASIPDRESAGIVCVIFGSAKIYASDVDLRNFAASLLGFAIYGSSPLVNLHLVAPAGDINGDGVDDFLVGDHSAVHIVHGQIAPRTTNVDTLTGNVVTFDYPIGPFFVSSLDGGKDLNGDGVPDLLLGSTFVSAAEGPASPNSGGVWLLSGPFGAPGVSAELGTAPAALSSAEQTSAAHSLSMVTNVVPPTDPSVEPTLNPSKVPSVNPSVVPSAGPSKIPSVNPSVVPSVNPSATPSVFPSAVPSAGPSKVPSVDPSMVPSVNPSVNPSVIPSVFPSAVPSTGPSKIPSANPSVVPSVNPSVIPSTFPSAVPSAGPSKVPSANPSKVPSMNPSVVPSVFPSAVPSTGPSKIPSTNPSVVPSVNPSVIPSTFPSAVPSTGPSKIPSANPSANPSVNPSAVPSVNPSVTPSVFPSAVPSVDPSVHPSVSPSVNPSAVPSVNPSVTPSASPSVEPSVNPSFPPSVTPSSDPSAFPSAVPTDEPSVQPSLAPSAAPSTDPTTFPSVLPSVQPILSPSVTPSVEPTVDPSAEPSMLPTVSPSVSPSATPTPGPTALPSAAPSVQPTGAPSVLSTEAPTTKPTIAAVKNFELTVNVEQVRLRLLVPFLKSTFFLKLFCQFAFFCSKSFL